MRYLLLSVALCCIFGGACTKKELYQDYAIQNTAENDEDLNGPAQ